MRRAPMALLVFLLGTPVGCSRPAVPSPSNSTRAIPAGAVDLTDRRGPGTRRMAERLKSFYKTVRVEDDVFMNAERAEMFRKRLGSASDANQILHLRLHVAQELLKAGKTLEAIQEFTVLEKFIGGNHLDLLPRRSLCHRWAAALRRRRTTPARPTRLVPNKTIVAGSGTGPGLPL